MILTSFYWVFQHQQPKFCCCFCQLHSMKMKKFDQSPAVTPPFTDYLPQTRCHAPYTLSPNQCPRNRPWYWAHKICLTFLSVVFGARPNSSLSMAQVHSGGHDGDGDRNRPWAVAHFVSGARFETHVLKRTRFFFRSMLATLVKRTFLNFFSFLLVFSFWEKGFIVVWSNHRGV